MTRFEDQKNKPSSAPTDKTALTTDCSDLSTTKITQKKKISKKRNWACVVYPESLPADWLDILQKTGLQIVISPLHNKDKNPDGTVKKPHYHIILIYRSNIFFSRSNFNAKIKCTCSNSFGSCSGLLQIFNAQR